MRKIELVKFKDGRYGVRRRRLFVFWKFEFFSGKFWFDLDYSINQFCKHTHNEALSIFEGVSDNGEAVKVEG